MPSTDTEYQRAVALNAELLALMPALTQVVAQKLGKEVLPNTFSWVGKIDQPAIDLVVDYLGLKLHATHKGSVEIDPLLSRRWVRVEATVQRARALIGEAISG